MKFYIKTFGCQMNERDSEKVYCIFREKGFEESSLEEADVIVINSCAVREKSEQKLLSELGRVRLLNRRAVLIAMGCVAQYRYRELEKIANFVVGTRQIDRFYEIADNLKGGGVFIDGVMSDPDRIFGHRDGVSAYVDVMYGCNYLCSYCIVPYTRGNEVYRSKKVILKEILQLLDTGVREVVLLGQNVNSYRDGKGYKFSDLLYDIDRLKGMGLERLRFVTPHPRDFSEDQAYAIRDLDTVCKHIHLPLQSGSDRILRLMKRRYSKEEYLGKIELVRGLVPDIGITTDIIVGFPGEEECEFEETMEVVKSVGFDTSYSFVYSQRPFTLAARMRDSVPFEEKLRRLNELQKLQAEITHHKLSMYKDKVVEVLVSGISRRGNCLQGRNTQNVVVNLRNMTINNIDSSMGMMVKVKVTDALKHSLLGDVV